jgi:hypothetical protein
MYAPIAAGSIVIHLHAACICVWRRSLERGRFKLPYLVKSPGVLVAVGVLFTGMLDASFIPLSTIAGSTKRNNPNALVNSITRLASFSVGSGAPSSACRCSFASKRTS